MKNQKLLTIKQYLNNEVTHSQYYGQFVTDEVKSQVKNIRGFESAKHPNDIPLNQWDILPNLSSFNMLYDCGDYVTLEGKVCIYKEAFCQLKGIYTKNKKDWKTGEININYRKTKILYTSYIMVGTDNKTGSIKEIGQLRIYTSKHSQSVYGRITKYANLWLYNIDNKDIHANGKNTDGNEMIKQMLIDCNIIDKHRLSKSYYADSINLLSNALKTLDYKEIKIIRTNA